MTLGWSAAPGTHAVQFYEGETFLHRAIGLFLSAPLRRGDPAVMITQRPRFQAVVDHLASAADTALAIAAPRVVFVDVETALEGFMVRGMPDPVRLERSVADLRAQVCGAEDATMWIYGEMAGTLCKRGNYAAGVNLEKLWNIHFSGPQFSVLCGYPIEDFDEDAQASHFRAICGQHTHVIPAEDFTDAPDDRARFAHVALLQHRARSQNGPATRDMADANGDLIVYVLDDDVSVRRSLARLLSLTGVQVQTFASASEFLAEVDRTARGCLILDVQLVGLSGVELQSRMAAALWSMPVIAMSGSHDRQIEADALRLGASAFLRKPFDAQALIDAVARALSSHGQR